MKSKLWILVAVTFLLQSYLAGYAYSKDVSLPQETVEKGVIPHAIDPATLEQCCIDREAQIELRNELEKDVTLPGKRDGDIMEKAKSDSELPRLPSDGNEEIDPEDFINKKAPGINEPPLTPVENLEHPKLPKATDETYPIPANPQPVYEPTETAGDNNPYDETPLSGSAALNSGSVITIVSLQEEIEEEEAENQAPSSEERNKGYLVWLKRIELERWDLGFDWTPSGYLFSPFYLE